MRSIGLLVAFVLALSAPPLNARQDDGIAVRAAHVHPTEEGLMLDADFEFALTPRLAEIVASGVPLYFRVEFELKRKRWYWFDESTASRELQLKLSYHALSRQYRLSTGLLQQNFGTLEEALHVMKRVRNWVVVDRTVPLSGEDYEVSVRMRHDTSLLPKPFQISALTTGDFQLESPWYRFTVRGLRQAPAPVESREPQEVPGR